MIKKKMGGLGKLSQFSGIKAQTEDLQSVDSTSTSQDTEDNNTNEPINALPTTESVRVKVEDAVQVEKTPVEKTSREEKLVVVNIKITKTQKDWLTDIASSVRDNNTEPVPPLLRVYPQHLIGVAIDLLRAQNVNWDGVENIEELREQLKI